MLVKTCQFRLCTIGDTLLTKCVHIWTIMSTKSYDIVENPSTMGV